MQIIVARGAGLDIHKKTVVAAVRTPDGPHGRAEQVRTFRTFQDELLMLRGWLLDSGVTQVAMEATSSYWRPVWRVLEDVDADGAFERLLLCNPRHLKRVPGRKTDVNDAQWLAELLECGLLAGSFVPPPAIRQLREATRYRSQLVAVRGQEVQRIEKVLEDAIVKIGSVASATLTKSGRAMIEALIGGNRNPEQLADLAYGRMRPKIGELIRALDSRFETHHATHLRRLLDHVDWIDARLISLDEQIAADTAGSADLLDRLQVIPGVGPRTSEVVLAETGGDMTVFPSQQHLASWTGICPGHNESGGKRHSGRIRQGNPWLRSALVQAAWAAQRANGTYLQAKFRRVAGSKPDMVRRKKAAVAVGHKILIAAYHLMADPTAEYHDLGADHFARHDDPDRRRDRLLAQLAKLGYDVALTPTTT